jgi:thiosulfate dehydrogenase [quinone] large subunit
LGELAVGIALIVGVFVGISAFFGAVMNFNYLMAGSASINPAMFVVALLLIFGWKTAGWIGLDRWLLPALGTPWEPGTVVKELAEQVRREPSAERVRGNGRRRGPHPSPMG